MAGDTNRRVALAIDPPATSVASYKYERIHFHELSTARTTTLSSFADMGQVGFILNNTGRANLQAKLMVRANPGGVTMTVEPRTDSSQYMTELDLACAGGSWANYETGWINVTSAGWAGLVSAALRWKVTSGTATFGSGALLCRWTE